MNSKLLIAAAALIAVPAFAATVDGTLDASYGAARAVQTVETGFGDNKSELNAAYAKIEGGRLFVTLTGNIENNFNKIDIFFDTKAGGENVLSSAPRYDFFNGSKWISENLGGMRFDNAFTADYHMFLRTGAGKAEVDFIDRNGGGSNQVPGASAGGSNFAGGISTGSIPAGAVGPNASGSSLGSALNFGYNGNNAAGVGGGNGPAANQAAALAVTTGFEFSIALSDLGNPGIGDTIRIAPMVNNGDHNYLSNQFLGGLPVGQGNLGGNGSGGFTGTLGGINFNNFAGDQFFTIVVPEPSSLSMLALAGLGLRRRR